MGEDVCLQINDTCMWCSEKMEKSAGSAGIGVTGVCGVYDLHLGTDLQYPERPASGYNHRTLDSVILDFLFHVMFLEQTQQNMSTKYILIPH